MKLRCNNKNNLKFVDYGGRGILVCERWSNLFENFLFDMGERLSKLYIIERINVDLNYDLINCKWVM